MSNLLNAILLSNLNSIFHGLILILRLHLEFLPIRLHLDQSQLNFLINFFGKDADRINSQPNDLEKSQIPGKKVNYGTKTIVEEALLPFFQARTYDNLLICKFLVAPRCFWLLEIVVLWCILLVSCSLLCYLIYELEPLISFLSFA